MLHDETGAYKISEEAVAAAVREWATTHGLRVDTSTSTLPEIYADTDGRVVDQKRRRVQSHALLQQWLSQLQPRLEELRPQQFVQEGKG